MRSLRVVWAVLLAIVILPIAGEFFIKLAEQYGFYEHPSERVGAIMNWLIALASNPIYRIAAAFVVGLALGSWLEILLRKFWSWLDYRAKRAKGQVGPIDHSRDIHDVYVHGKRILISELFDQEASITGKTYSRCVFLGPAMVSFVGCKITLDHFTIDEKHGIESVIYEIPEGKYLIGPVMFKNCTFDMCEFQKTGFMFTKPGADEFRRSLHEALARQNHKLIPR